MAKVGTAANFSLSGVPRGTVQLTSPLRKVLLGMSSKFASDG